MITNQFPTACGRYFVTSYGNGWAYEIEELHSGHTVWFQDSDACMVQQVTNNFEDSRMLADYFEAEEYEFFIDQPCEFDR